MANEYVSLAEVKSSLGITDTNDDAEIDIAREAASRAIDDYCGRIFYDTVTATAKTFKATDAYSLSVPDFHTTTGLVIKTDTTDDGTFDETWATDEYQVEPLDPSPGWPWHRLVAIDVELFPTGGRRARVQVTAKWGWAAIPAAIKQAALLQSTRYFKRKDAPFGVAGGGELGAIMLKEALDPDVMALVSPFQKVFA